MKVILKLEYVAILVSSWFLSVYIGFSWWTFLLLFFLPDLSMLGYVAGPKAGAFLYNTFHHYAVAIIVSMAGLILPDNNLLLCGLVLAGHSAFDRMLGYGLKYDTGFHNTHLGVIGKSKQLGAQ